MAQYRKIEYIISKDGKVTERVIDGAGKECVDNTAEIEANLGKVKKRDLLPEYYEESAIAEVEISLSESV
jgi:Protein of unknown function (DUF2997)